MIVVDALETVVTAKAQHEDPEEQNMPHPRQTSVLDRNAEKATAILDKHLSACIQRRKHLHHSGELRYHDPLVKITLSGNGEHLERLISQQFQADPESVSRYIQRVDKHESTLLHYCAWHGNIAMAKALIGKGVDVNAQNRRQYTAAHIAFRSGQFDFLQFLLGNKINSELRDRTQKRFFEMDLSNNLECSGVLAELAKFDPAIAQWLYPTGEKKPCFKRIVSDVEDVRMSVVRLLENGGDKDALVFLLNMEVGLDAAKHMATVNRKNHDGETPLMRVAWTGDVQAVQTLLSMKAVTTVQDEKGNTAFHYAAARGDKDVLKVLLEAEGQKYSAIPVNKQGMEYNEMLATCCPLAIKQKFDRWLQRRKIEQQSWFHASTKIETLMRGKLARLHYHQDKKCIVTIQALFRGRQARRWYQYSYGELREHDPLFQAMMSGNEVYLQKAITQYGGSTKQSLSRYLHRTDSMKRGLLFYAAWQGCEFLLNLLVSGLDAAMVDAVGNSAAHAAVEQGHYKLLQMLWRQGTPPKQANAFGKLFYELVPACNPHRQESLLLLAEENHVAHVEYEKEVDHLAHKFPQELHDAYYGLHLIHTTIEGDVNKMERVVTSHSVTGDEAATRELRRTFVNEKDWLGNTALHHSVFKRNYQAVKFLLESRASVDARNANKEIPLHFAIHQWQPEIVRELLWHGSDTNALSASNMRSGQNYSELCGEILRAKLELDVHKMVKDMAQHKVAAIKLQALRRAKVQKGEFKRMKHATTKIQALFRGHFARKRAVPLPIKQCGLIKDNDPMLRAIINNDAEAFQKAVANRPDQNVPPEIWASRVDRKGNTLLFQCAWNGQIDMAQTLLQIGFDINKQNFHGDTPAHLACERGHVDFIHFLIGVGLKDNIVNKLGLFWFQTHSRFDPAYDRFLEAIHDIDPTVKDKHPSKHVRPQMMVRVGSVVQPVPVQTSPSYQLLLEYVLAGDCGGIVAYVEASPGDRSAKVALLNQIDIAGHSLLLMAVWHGEVEVVKTLLELGANVNYQDCDGNAAPHVASERLNIPILNLLVAHGFNTETPNNHGQRYLETLSPQCPVYDFNIFMEFIESKGSELHEQNAAATRIQSVLRGRTEREAYKHKKAVMLRTDPLLKLARSGRHQDLQTLIVEQVGHKAKTVVAWLNRVDSYGGNAVFHAIWKGNAETVEALIAAGVNINHKDSQENTAAHLAVLRGQDGCLEALLRLGINQKAVNIEGKLFSEIVSPLDPSRAMPNEKLVEGPDVLAPDDHLLYATRAGDAEQLQNLLTERIDQDDLNSEAQVANKIDVYGSPLLFHAVWRGHVDAVKVLLNSGADVNKLDSNSKTATHLAIDRCRLDIVQLLADYDFDFSLLSTGGDKSYVDVVPPECPDKQSTIKWLIMMEKKAKKRQRDKRKRKMRMTMDDPLLYAAKMGDVVAMTQCIMNAAGKDQNEIMKYVNRVDDDGSSALIHASWWGHFWAVKLLLECGADVNIQNKRKNTAAHMACQRDHSAIVKLCLDSGYDANLRNLEGHRYYQMSSIAESANAQAPSVQSTANPQHHKLTRVPSERKPPRANPFNTLYNELRQEVPSHWREIERLRAKRNQDPHANTVPARVAPNPKAHQQLSRNGKHRDAAQVWPAGGVNAPAWPPGGANGGRRVGLDIKLPSVDTHPHLRGLPRHHRNTQTLKSPQHRGQGAKPVKVAVTQKTSSSHDATLPSIYPRRHL